MFGVCVCVLYILPLKAAAERIAYLETRLEYEELETDGSHAVQSMGGIQAGSGSFSFQRLLQYNNILPFSIKHYSFLQSN